MYKQQQKNYLKNGNAARLSVNIDAEYGKSIMTS